MASIPRIIEAKVFPVIAHRFIFFSLEFTSDSSSGFLQNWCSSGGYFPK
jgi:hypothetical protein